MATILRHPLASKRCMMVFSANGEETMEVFELLSQYEAVGPIGQGTYGYVCSARDNDKVDSFNLDPPPEYEDGSLSAEEKQELYDSLTLVAVKKLRQLFENNQPRMWLCATREIQLMMSFNHDNVMSATDFFIPLGGVENMTYESILSLQSNFDSVYVVMKKMDYTLREVLDSSVVTAADVPPEIAAGFVVASPTTNPGDFERQYTAATPTTTTSSGSASTGATGSGDQSEPLCCPVTHLVLHPLSRDYRKFILYQILRGVGYLHLCPVIHRDLKPENIMLDRSYNTCITDFGQGRDVGVGAEFLQTVLDNCTQWYAAPETLTLGLTSSTGFIDHASFHGVDVWSIGCIAAEMLIGRPLFYTTSMGGMGQLGTILSTLGAPSEEATTSLAEYRDEGSREIFGHIIRRATGTGNVPAASLLNQLLKSPYGDEDPDEVALIASCFAWDPRERTTIQAALESPFFTSEGYDPVIDPDDTATRVPSVRPEDISEPVSGRAFLWDLFVQRHPEVKELWRSLVKKHEHEEERAATAAVERAAGASPATPPASPSTGLEPAKKS